MIETSPTPRTSRASRRHASERNIVLAAKGGGITFLGTMFAYAVRTAIGILLARYLGARQFGLYSLATTAGAIAAGLALLGFQTTMVRYVALFVGRRDAAGLWGTLQLGLGATTITSLLLAVGLYALSNPIAASVFHEPSLAPLLRLTSLTVPFLALNYVISAATRGFNNMHYTVIAQNITQPLMRLITLVAFALIGLTAAKALTSYLVTLIAAFVLLFYFLNRQFPLRRPPQKARRDTREIFIFALPVYVTRLIKTFRGNIQTLLLGTLDTVKGVGIFAAAARINVVGRMFQRSIATASRPIVSELYDREEWKALGSFYQTMTKWTFTLNVPLFLCVLLFPQPILSIFGKGFAGGASALSLLAWVNLVEAATGINGVVIDMTGKTGLKVVNSLIVSGLTIGLNLLLIPRWGIVGAATAALVGSTIVNLLRLFEVFFLFHMLPYNASFAKPIAAGLVALSAAGVMRQLIHAETSLAFAAVNAAFLLAVYVGMVLLLGLSKEDRIVMARVRTRMGSLFGKAHHSPHVRW